MTEPVSAGGQESSLVRYWFYAAHFYVGRRNMILILAALAIAGGIAMNWNWLVASALAPIVIALLPCAVMCALGLCMHRLSGKAGASGDSGRIAPSNRTDELGDQSNHPRAIDTDSRCCGGAVDSATPFRTTPPQDDERNDSDAQAFKEKS
jgi:hypothetical protein